MTTAALSIQSTVEGGIVRVRLTGELDIHAAPEVAGHLTEIAAQVVDTVLVDVSGLSFLDSSGLRAIVEARNEFNEAGATFFLEGVAGVVERILDATGLRALLTAATAAEG